jgi:uncharacterized protein YkwD
LPQTHKVFLPFVGGGSNNITTFGHLLLTDPRQQRVGLLWSKCLQIAAATRAESLATLRYWGHCDLSGKCANTFAREAGCKLPAYYGNGNNIESLVAGTNDVQLAFDSLAQSSLHAVHLFGQNNFFREQTHFGIAYLDAPVSVYHYYWVILIGICLW